MAKKTISKVEELTEKIATGKRELITVHRSLLPEVAENIENKYSGTFTFFVFGSTAHVQRDSKKPMTLRP